MTLTHAQHPQWLYALILLLSNSQSRHSVTGFSLLSQRYPYRRSEDYLLALHRYPQIPRAHHQPSMTAALATATALTGGGRPDITSATLSFGQTFLGQSLLSNLSIQPTVDQ